MVVAEGEVESPLQSEQTPKNQALSSLGTQSSIYALTLDEFQHALCEGGKNFGSMNMDEFLSSIWNAEENRAINNNNNSHFSLNEASSDKGTRKQPSLPRQGSLSIPSPLSRKTVDQVWSEIHNNNDGASNAQNAESAPRQPPFGEMTLEDFLIKAGVVRESGPMPAPAAQQQYGVYPNNKCAMGPTFGIGYAGMGNGKRDRGTGYPSPVSPVLSDGIGASEMGVLRGRKRIRDGSVEKVVERRQRRMIKNRESAARSRARKQAYTVELEAELNQLRKENAQLKLALAELERRRKRQCFEELNNNLRVQTKAQKAKEKLRTFRRNLSCPL